jgi:5'-nucleotidase
MQRSLAEPASGGRPADDRPLILMTNDDGYDARGLVSLAAALADMARVVVVAPTMEQSACSHKLTLHTGLRLHEVREGWFRLDGTPADCVYVGLFAGDRVLPRKPDLVVSGLNEGPNLGLDVYYSGTVAGAREAAMRGVPGLAVSADPRADLDAAAKICASIAKAAIACAARWSSPPVLNVNVPPGSSWQVCVTRPGRRVYGEGVEFRRDPRGREYLWIGGPGVRNEGAVGTDTAAFEAGQVGVSSLPLRPHEPDPEDPAAVVVRQWERLDDARRIG